MKKKTVSEYIKSRKGLYNHITTAPTYNKFTQSHLNEILDGFVSQSEANIEFDYYKVTPLTNGWYEVKCGNIVFHCGKGFLEQLDKEFKKRIDEYTYNPNKPART